MKNVQNAGRKITPREILRRNSGGADLLYLHVDYRVALGAQGGGRVIIVIIKKTTLDEIPCEVRLRLKKKKVASTSGGGEGKAVERDASTARLRWRRLGGSAARTSLARGPALSPLSGK